VSKSRQRNRILSNIPEPAPAPCPRCAELERRVLDQVEVIHNIGADRISLRERCAELEAEVARLRAERDTLLAADRRPEIGEVEILRAEMERMRERLRRMGIVNFGELKRRDDRRSGLLEKMVELAENDEAPSPPKDTEQP